MVRVAVELSLQERLATDLTAQRPPDGLNGCVEKLLANIERMLAFSRRDMGLPHEIR